VLIKSETVSNHLSLNSWVMCRVRVDVIETVSTTPDLPTTLIFISPSIDINALLYVFNT
jgi:hypothetical protein